MLTRQYYESVKGNEDDVRYSGSVGRARDGEVRKVMILNNLQYSTVSVWYLTLVMMHLVKCDVFDNKKCEKKDTNDEKKNVQKSHQK